MDAEDSSCQSSKRHRWTTERDKRLKGSSDWSQRFLDLFSMTTTGEVLIQKVKIETSCSSHQQLTG